MSVGVIALGPAELALIEILGAVIQTIAVTDNDAADRLREALGKLRDKYLVNGNDDGLAVLHELRRVTPSGVIPHEE